MWKLARERKIKQDFLTQRRNGKILDMLATFRCAVAPLREKILAFDCVAEAVTNSQYLSDQLRMIDEVAIELSQRHS